MTISFVSKLAINLAGGQLVCLFCTDLLAFIIEFTNFFTMYANQSLLELSCLTVSHHLPVLQLLSLSLISGESRSVADNRRYLGHLPLTHPSVVSRSSALSVAHTFTAGRMLFRLLFLFTTLHPLLGQHNLKVLRPCFERYANHRLVNVRPYHSEWRMKAEEQCLQFCVETASRCRSIVYDSAQHICHFFLDEGDDQAIIAARMVYFRVVSKDCLDHVSDTLNTVSVLENPLQNFSTIPTQAPDAATVTIVDSALEIRPKEVNPLEHKVEIENHAEAIDEKYKMADRMTGEMNFGREQTEFIGSFGSDSSDDTKIEKNEVLRDINPMGDMEKRWQSSMEQLQKNTDDYVFKGARMEPSLMIPAQQHHETIADSKYEDELLENAFKQEVANTKQKLSKKLGERLDKLKELYPEKYVEYVSSHESEFTGPEENSQLTRPKTEWVDEMATKASTRVNQRRKKTKFEARRIKFTEESSFPKKLNSVAPDVRRKPTRPPLKQVLASDSPSFMHKARSFLDSVNTKEVELQLPKAPQFDNTALVQKASEGVCPRGESPVWISFENSMDNSTSAIDSSYAQNKNQCQSMCSQESCTSFTFFDKEKQCMVNINSEGVSLMAPPGGNYTASTSTKFCFSDSLPIFHECSNFIGFRDFALEVYPREQFEGLPRGYLGMKLCVELCVLSTEYTCRSASFLIDEGRCLLNEDDSLSRSEDFRASLSTGHLYFENGCSASNELNTEERKATQVERFLPKRNQSTVKQLHIKKIKPLKNSIEKTKSFEDAQRSSSELINVNEQILQDFFNKRNN